MNRIYIFIGPEGAGKSTQSRLLAEKLQLPRISTGDMLREFAKNDTGRLGRAAKDMFTQNGYLDAELMLAMMGETLQNEIYAHGVVLDGSLRTYDEVKHFDEMLELIHRILPVSVVFIDITEAESIERLSYGRNRSDDIIESVKTRLSHFHDRLDERLALIKEKYQLIKINGMQSKEMVQEEIVEKLGVLSKE